MACSSAFLVEKRGAVSKGGAAPQGRGGGQEKDGGGRRAEEGAPQGDREEGQRRKLQGEKGCFVDLFRVRGYVFTPVSGVRLCRVSVS